MNDVQITICGNTTAPAEIRFTSSGAPVASFTVAHTPRTFDRAANVGRPAAFVGNHIIEVLDFMAEDPDKWRAMNPENGWGSYDVCLQGRMRRWAQACLDAPTGATIGGWL